MKKLIRNGTAVLLLSISFCISNPGNCQFIGVFTVGPGGNFPNLTGPGGFFDLLNNEPAGMVGVVELRITGNLCEPGTHFLNGSKLNNFVFKVYPNPGAPLPILISNCSDINQGLIRMDGVSNTTISGLTIINTNSNPANAKPVLEFINASNNVIVEDNTLRCNDPSLTEGTVMLGGGVHNGMIIRNNIITDAVGGSITNYPANGIYSNNATSQLQISNNTISNNTNYAIYLNTGNGTVVDNNRVFQSVPKQAGGGGIFCTGGGNLTITNNVIGNGNETGGATWQQVAGDFFGIFANPNTFAPNPALSSTISGNTVEDVDMSSPGTPSFSGIFVQQGNVSISNNTIRNNTFNCNGFIHGVLVSPVSNSTHTISGNVLSNLNTTLNGTTTRLVGVRNQGGGGQVTIQGNTFSHFQTVSGNTSVTAPGLAGIDVASSAGETDIYFNEFNAWWDFSLAQSTVTGINVNSFPNTIKIERNKFTDFRNTGAPGSGIFGLNLQGGSGQVVNNFIGLTNNGAGNDVSATGINFGGSSSSVYNAIYNSVFIGILLSGGSSSTYAVRRPSSAVINFLNNAFVNNSTGGTGNHLAIGNTRTSSTATGFNGCNYNFLFTRDPAKVNIWGSAVLNYPDWITTSGMDPNSIQSFSPESDPTALWDGLTGNFVYHSNSPFGYYMYGNANPVAGITTDQRGIPGTRPDQVSNGTPDIGAYEMEPPTVNPPDMMITGITAPGATQDAFFGGHKFASITWGPGGTLPVLNYIRRFPFPPPGFNGGNPNLKSISNYFDINATGGSGYSANTTIYWFPNADGRISPISAALMAKQQTGGPWIALPGSVYSSTGPPLNYEAIFNDVAGYSLFTAVDPSSTLPVNLLSFTAQKNNNDIVLHWTTAGETEHDHFEPERSSDGARFSPVGIIPGQGNTSAVKTYLSTDAKALLLNMSKLFYRLKMVSKSGTVTYSHTIQVPLAGKNNQLQWQLSPNPFVNRIAVNLYLPENAPLQFSLYNMNGQSLRQKMVRGEKGYSTVEWTDLEGLLPGTYFIQLRQAGKILSSKLLKTGQR